jgi:leucyl/phenylalanyl-tRNA--protein transferase
MNGQNEPIHSFPPAESADEDGVVFVGGRIDVQTMLKAYKSGIFPWPCEFDDGTWELLWCSPEPRSILEFSDFHVSSRLTRRIKRNEFEFTWNTCFEQVVFECSRPRGSGDGVWITEELLDAF